MFILATYLSIKFGSALLTKDVLIQNENPNCTIIINGDSEGISLKPKLDSPKACDEVKLTGQDKK